MRPTLFRVSVLLFLLAMLGCSYTSVGHLQRQPWILNTEQGLEMRFWNFLYIAESSEGKYRITGLAMPRAENLPENLNWINDLRLAAYLSDDQGRVLAQDLQVLSGLPLDPGQGVPFTFTLRPDRLNRSASLQITFGYNMTLTPHEHYLQQDSAVAEPSEGRSAVFFAHEGALTKI